MSGDVPVLLCHAERGVLLGELIPVRALAMRRSSLRPLSALTFVSLPRVAGIGAMHTRRRTRRHTLVLLEQRSTPHRSSSQRYVYVCVCMCVVTTLAHTPRRHFYCLRSFPLFLLVLRYLYTRALSLITRCVSRLHRTSLRIIVRGATRMCSRADDGNSYT